MAWRKKHYGFDPAYYYYVLAQDKLASGSKNSAMNYLRQAFSWDPDYVQKAENDPVFKVIRGYERYKVLLAKYENIDKEKSTS
mgnify:FL=1